MANEYCWIIFNGPSSSQFIGYKLPGPVFGCNFAYKDFPVTDLFAVDRMAVHAIRKEAPECRNFYTKKTPLELPPGWQHHNIPGIDSGSYAIEQACIQYPRHTKIIIGADGVLKLNSTTRYVYAWRGGRQPQGRTHLQHRDTVIALTQKYSNQKLLFVTNCQDTYMETITFDDCIRKTGLVMDAKHTKYTKT